jgi:hypothetical protein
MKDYVLMCTSTSNLVYLNCDSKLNHLMVCNFSYDLIYVPLVVNISRSFPHSRLITGFVTRLTRRVPPVEQELLTLPEHLSSPPILSVGYRISKKSRQHNGRKKKYKRTNNDRQNIHIKLKIEPICAKHRHGK